MSFPGYAFSVLEAYYLALKHDPVLLAAIQEKKAGDENEKINKSSLLPKLTFNYQNSPYNWQESSYKTNDIFGNTSDESRKQRYHSYSGSVMLTQPLFDYEAYSRYKVGVAQTLISDRRYREKTLNLAIRVVSAYTDISYARDKIELAKAKKTSYKEQLKINERLLAAGEGTVTDVLETQARYNLSEAQLIEAYDNLDAAQRQLEWIVGVPLDQLSAFEVLRQGPFQTLTMTHLKFEEWKKKALEKNPLLAALRHGVEAAKYEIERNRAGFMPNIQLYASHSISNSSNDNTVNQRYNTNSIGLRVSIPLYDGGGTAASLRQATARYGQTQAEMDVQITSVINNLRKQFNLCLRSRAMIKAYELTVQSAREQVIATRKSVIAGQRVNIDVLNAQQQLFSAQQDLASAKYTYIKSWITLLGESGLLEENDVKQITNYFAPPSS
ncbi:TolC family outer membrane protein [Salmonella enterica]|nr:TolC family outer membrane protein [Salmonella enterica]